MSSGRSRAWGDEVRLYTRGGDEGETGLLGNRRVAKSDPVIEAIGQLDELNAWIGLVVAVCADPSLAGILRRIQSDLFELGAELASPDPRHKLSFDRIAELEQEIDRLSEELPPLRHFILPGGDVAGAYCHVARAVARRAERSVVGLGHNSGSGASPDPLVVVYLNRLSDLLFAVARVLNHRRGRPEQPWTGDNPGPSDND